MNEHEKVNILMVDDQPAKLLSYEVILGDLGENLIKANSAKEALAHLLKDDIAIILMDVSMPELDGFELAEIIRQHPRYQKTAIIFVSAVRQTDLDRIKGYASGAVDYLSVPVIPELLRAKVRVFAELHRKTRQLERLNSELERRVAERTVQIQKREQLLKASLQEKEVLLKEIHHRVKNNLQVICSLLNLQAENIAEPHIRELFSDSQQRVRSLALVHEKLYQATDMARIDLAEYAQSLATSLVHCYSRPGTPIAMRVEGAELFLEIEKAVPCGLIINELVSNALKHAFPNGRQGNICISLRAGTNGQVTLRVSDDGVGFPPGLDFRNTRSLGLQLVTILTGQLKGTIELENAGGTAFQIRFPAA